MAGRFAGMSDLEWRLFEDVFPPAPPKRGRGMPHAPFRKRLMLDSRVIDVRIVYTHHIPCPNPCQESNVAGQYHESGR